MRGTRLHVTLEVTERTVPCALPRRATPGNDDDDMMRAQLLEALAPDARWVAGDEVRFSVPLSA